MTQENAVPASNVDQPLEMRKVISSQQRRSGPHNLLRHDAVEVGGFLGMGFEICKKALAEHPLKSRLSGPH